MQLMCNMTVSKREVEELFDIPFDEYFAEPIQALRPLEADGLVTIADGGISVTDIGRFFLRNIAVQFDRYMTHADKKMFSKAI
jgi:oxygen-independent coproporphyrinogen-3 oxidase